MRKIASITAIVVGIIMAIAGVVTWVVVSTTLSDQKITVSEDAACAAGDEVDGPISAYCQADVIDKHTREITGGKTYAELDREDPNRATAMDSAFLQASLFTSVVAFGVAAMAFALGVVLTLIGFAMRAARALTVSDGDRPARLEDVHDLAMGMPHVRVDYGTGANPVYQVGGKSFVFFRNPRPDAVDPDTGERYADVIVFWVASEADKLALVQDASSPFFTTPHFDGHQSVLLRASRLGELTRGELAEVVQDAWLCRASARRASDWLGQHPPSSAQ